MPAVPSLARPASQAQHGQAGSMQMLLVWLPAYTQPG